MNSKKTKKQELKQLQLDSANPLTARGRYEIAKQLRKLKGKKASKQLRQQLENQEVNKKSISNPYGSYMERHGLTEYDSGSDDYSEDSEA